MRTAMISTYQSLRLPPTCFDHALCIGLPPFNIILARYRPQAHVFDSFSFVVMSSERPSARGYTPVDSPDTESLLYEEGSREKLLGHSSSHTLTSNKWTGIYLHIIAVLLYGTITVLLFIWGSGLHNRSCECEQGFVYCEKRIIHTEQKADLLTYLVSSCERCYTARETGDRSQSR